MSFPFYKQLDAKDCGPACLRMIAKFYGKNFSLQTLRDRSFLTRSGVSLLGMSDAADSIGFRTMGVAITPQQLYKEAPLPCILHWKQNHFVILYEVKTRKKTPVLFRISDPGVGLVDIPVKEFLDGWLSTREKNEEKGIALLLEPTPDFFAQEDEITDKSKFRFLLKYLKSQKRLIVQLILGMVLGSLFQLLLPFLTQAIVDKGIGNLDIDFINIVLLAMITLTISRTLVDIIRNWILLHLSTRINVSLISDFLIKLMKLPIGFFDTRLIGDLMQRIWDHNRIQTFLTVSSLGILFGFFNLIVFGIVLAIYSIKIFLVFLAGSLIYFIWISLFMKKRRELDYKRFGQLSENQSSLYELITGMQEIKLNNCETKKRWRWEQIQAKLFKTNVKTLTLTQYQQIGGLFFNETKNIFIIFLAATAVVNGEMSLGMMVAVQFVIGQMNSPIDQMIGFMQAAQDAKISLERLAEVHLKKDEELVNEDHPSLIPAKGDIHLNNVSFQYEGPHSAFVLSNVSLNIPAGKVTAIVGPSGSGKTTLLKLLLGFYPPSEGEITIDQFKLQNLSHRLWRSKCGTVMQDGFLFSDNIAANIAPSEDEINRKKLFDAVHIANIGDFIAELPLGFNTKIGQEGSGISQGQKQRILIARAVYKDPDFLFFDEATNALDAENERVIMNNLKQFFKGRTVLVVAHRLSTVKDADQIVVLEKGKLVESGTHDELTAKRGRYFQLVKNQLELGS